MNKRLLIFACAGLTATAWPSEHALASPPSVRLPQGELIGTHDQGARAFLGIPYAKPPLGPLRWRAPQAAERWQGARDATHFGPNCMQGSPEPFGPWTAEFIAGPVLSEDCLTLNVWTPARPASKNLPVLVWIHGGAFSGGSGSVAVYKGAALAQRGAIVVTINYRLGIFGFMAHPALSAESPRHISGNYGLLDMIAALHWVQRNIVRFGGDPSTVTIAGQSAGAAAVNDLIVSPEARGLFARAIAESGSGMGIPIQTLAAAERQGEAVVHAAGFAGIDALRALSAQQVLELKVPPQSIGASVSTGLQLPFGPILDGAVLPADAEHGNAAVVSAVPLLTGYTADESRSMGPLAVNAAEFAAQLRARYGAHAERLLALYPHANDKEADESAWLQERDRYMVSLTLWSLARTANAGQPVYAYLFDRVLPGPDAARYRSFHTAEVPYVFGTLDKGVRPYVTQDETVSRLVQSYWLNFMRTGNPNGAEVPVWPRFEAQSGKVMLLGDRPGPVWPASSGERYQALSEYAAAGGQLSLF